MVANGSLDEFLLMYRTSPENFQSHLIHFCQFLLFLCSPRKFGLLTIVLCSRCNDDVETGIKLGADFDALPGDVKFTREMRVFITRGDQSKLCPIGQAV